MTSLMISINSSTKIFRAYQKSYQKKDLLSKILILFIKYLFKFMNSKQKRIESVLKQLYNMHEELFGQKYGIGMALDEASQFNKIVEQFREVIFIVKSSQEERQMRENKKNYLQTPERLKINQQIREDIARAQEILKEAAKRVHSGDIDEHVRKNRQKILSNCYNILKDAKQVEQGGDYMPPSHPTFQEIKAKLLEQKNIRNSGHSDGIDLEEELAFEKFNQKEKQQDDIILDIVDVNKRVRNKMIVANEKIDESKEQIQKNKKKMEQLTKRVLKADSELAEIVKKYQRPSQCCLNVTLILMVLALVGVIISLFKGQTV